MGCCGPNMADDELLEELEEGALLHAEVETEVPPRGAFERAQGEAEGDPRWRVTLYTTWLAQLGAMMAFSFVMPFIPFYVRDELGVRDPRVLPIWCGALVTGSGVVMSLVAPIWGTVADRYGRKMMVQRAMFGGAVILSAMSRVHTVQQLLALRMLQGGFTGTVSASVALVSSVVPAAQLGFSLGLMQMAVSAGASLGPLLGGVAAEQWGTRNSFLVTGGLLLVAGALVRFGARERFQRPVPGAAERSLSARDLFRSRTFLTLLVVYSMLNLSLSFPGEIFPLFVERVIGNSRGAASATGLLIAVSGLAAAVAAALAGRLSDRYGYKKVLVICVTVVGLLSFNHLWVWNLGQLLVLRALIGLASGGMVPSMNAMIASLVPRRSLGKAYGFTTTASSLGWAGGPLFGGLAASVVGLRLPFAFTGVMLLAMAFLAYRFIRTTPVTA